MGKGKKKKTTSQSEGNDDSPQGSVPQAPQQQQPRQGQERRQTAPGQQAGRQMTEQMQGLRVDERRPGSQQGRDEQQQHYVPREQQPRGREDNQRGFRQSAGPRDGQSAPRQDRGREDNQRGFRQSAGPRDDQSAPRQDRGREDNQRGFRQSAGPRDGQSAPRQDRGREDNQRGFRQSAGPRDDQSAPRQDRGREDNQRGFRQSAGPRDGQSAPRQDRGREDNQRGFRQSAGPRDDQSAPRQDRGREDNQPGLPQSAGPAVGQQAAQPKGPWGNQPGLPQSAGPAVGQQAAQPKGPWGNQPGLPQSAGPAVGQQAAQSKGPWGNQPGLPQSDGSQGGQQRPQKPAGPQGGQQPTGPGGNQQKPQQRESPQVSRAPSREADVSAFGSPIKPSNASDKKTLPKGEQNRLLSLIPMRKVPGKAGTEGRKITVRTNMMSIIFGNKFKTVATHYDVKFDPDKPKFLKRLAFNKLREQKFSKNWPAFDGRANAYSAGDLPFGENLTAEVEVFDEERQKMRPVNVTMMKVNSIDLSWLKEVRAGLKEHEKDLMTMQVLDVILRCASYERGVIVGRSCFQRPSAPEDLGSGMELWSGLFHSAVLGWKPYINVDVANKAFPKPQSVLNAIKDLCSTHRDRCNTLDARIIDRNYDKIQAYLKGLKIVYQLPNMPTTRRTMGVNGLSKSAREATFAMDNGEVTTVEKYFAGAKKYRIQHPDFPCLWVGPRMKVPNILVPLELCTIASGLVTNRKLDENQTRGMIRQTAVPPAAREKKIKDTYNTFNFNSNPTMNEFGISITGEFATVGARVLTPPALRDSRNILVAKGVWRANEFYRAGELQPGSWTILNLSEIQDRQLYSFVDMLKRNDNGMKIEDPVSPFDKIKMGHNVFPTLIKYFEAMKQKGLRLVVVVIPGRFADAYPKVKQVAELKVGILTQCVKDNTINRMDKSTAGNILLKINSKLNGVNHTFQETACPNCIKGPCIIFGADVTHPSPDATDIPSIAAVASSFERTAFKYNVTIRLQPPRQEIIIHLEEIVYNQISNFMRINKCKPGKIIFYRDGVSEGQFPQVMHFELQAIRNACRRIGGAEKYEPKITFLVVQKRHHIRLFPTNRNNSDDRNGNVQAGTVVDTEITHPSHIDFYLVSHASIQGTARPTKYRCLWDDNDLSEDEIEQLTYYLCHMFSRCTRSVSYPAPTYYAHLAAFRARALISNVPIQINNLDQEQRTKLTLRQEIVQNSPMFFV